MGRRRIFGPTDSRLGRCGCDVCTTRVFVCSFVRVLLVWLCAVVLVGGCGVRTTRVFVGSCLRCRIVVVALLRWLCVCVRACVGG